MALHPVLCPRMATRASLRPCRASCSYAVARRWCALPLLANAMHCPCHACLRCALPPLCHAYQCPCHAVVAAQSRRIESLCRCHARPCHRPCIPTHRHRRADSAMLMRANAAPRSAAAYLCFAAALPCVRCSAAAKQRLALQRHSCPTQSSALAMPIFAAALLAPAMPSRCCPKPCRRNALLRSASAALARAFPCPSWAVHCPCWPAHCFAFARRSGAAQCRRRASHCPAFASPCPAMPPLIGAPTCLASASPCSALALLCHPVASPSLAIALLRRATP